MAVVVEASGILAERIPAGLTIEDVHSVGDVVERLGLASRSGVIILVNNRLASWETELKAGDVVHLIPAVAGG